MKNLLIGMILMTVSASSLASQCGAYFNSTITNNVIESFMLEKLDVSSEEITNLEFSDQKSFVSAKQTAALALFSPIIVVGVAVDKHSTFKEVVNDLKYCGTNLKVKVQVEFSKDNQLCTVDLKVKLKTDFTYEGVTSVVKQKFKPVCR